jgi:hypothetical protein
LANLSKRPRDGDSATHIWSGLAGRGNLRALEHLAAYHERVWKQLDYARRYSDQLIRQGYRIEAQRAREHRLLRQR